MKLDEFHVGHAATCSPCHGHAIAGADVWVGGVQIHFAGTAGCQHGVLRGDGDHFACGFIQHVSAQTSVSVAVVIGCRRLWRAFAGHFSGGD